MSLSNEERYRIALERIANMDHDEACDSSAPLMECGCYEKDPHELAQMALNGIDWEPESRKKRALEHFKGFEGEDNFFVCRRMCYDALSKLSDEKFERQSLYVHDLIPLAVRHMTKDERARLSELSVYDIFDTFKDAIEMANQEPVDE